MTSDSSQTAPNDPASSVRATGYLFLVSVLILFLELACIRWFPAHVLFLTFFTNSVLLASFLGMSLGCLATAHKRSYLVGTPSFLAVGVIAALGVEILHAMWDDIVGVGIPGSSQVIFFGSEQSRGDLAQFYIPVEVLGGFFFVL